MCESAFYDIGKKKINEKTSGNNKERHQFVMNVPNIKL